MQTQEEFLTLRDHMQTVIVGQFHLIDCIMIGVLTVGHLLLEGPPGLAKTTAVKALAEAVEGLDLAVSGTLDAFEALEMQQELQSKYTGGTVLHLYMGERIASPEACARLVRRALENYRLPYITITPTFSICPLHGYLSGEHEFCPKCDQELLARH